MRNPLGQLPNKILVGQNVSSASFPKPSKLNLNLGKSKPKRTLLLLLGQTFGPFGKAPRLFLCHATHLHHTSLFTPSQKSPKKNINQNENVGKSKSGSDVINLFPKFKVQFLELDLEWHHFFLNV